MGFEKSLFCQIGSGRLPTLEVEDFEFFFKFENFQDFEKKSD